MIKLDELQFNEVVRLVGITQSFLSLGWMTNDFQFS